MQMVEIYSLENGSHNNQTYHGVLPDGWAIIPDSMELENFPFGDVVVEEIDGVMTVVEWIPGVMPEPETPTDSTNLEARVTALESAIERGLSL